MGAIIRTAYFLGIGGIIVTLKNSPPLNATVSKVSSGAMEFMRIHGCYHLPRLLKDSKKNGWEVIGTGNGENSKSFNNYEMKKATILVFGNN